MNLDRLKQDVGHTWKRMAEGWRHISDKAANALTYFTPSNDDAESGIRWGLLAVDVSEKPDSIHVQLEAPGLDKDDIDIDVQGRQLIVTGRKSYESERTEGAMVISERAFGHFQRVVPLPDLVTTDAAQAKYRNGVLDIELPRRSPPASRKITVTKG
jgi:HSP20 family protein